MAAPGTVVEPGPIDTDKNTFGSLTGTSTLAPVVAPAPTNTGTSADVTFSQFPTSDGTVQVRDTTDVYDPRGSSQTPSYEDIRAQNIAAAAQTDADGTVLESTTDETVQQSTDLDDFASQQAARDEQTSGAGDEAAAQNLIAQRQKEAAAAAAAGGGNSGCVNTGPGSAGAGDLGTPRNLGDVSSLALADLPADSRVISPEITKYLTTEEIEYAQGYGSRPKSVPGGLVIWPAGGDNKHPPNIYQKIVPAACARLLILAKQLGPLSLVSAYRSPDYNGGLAKRSKGVAKGSLHMRGLAFDIAATTSKARTDIIIAASALGFGGIAPYGATAGNFVHIDIGARRTWYTGGAGAKSAEEKNAMSMHLSGGVQKSIISSRIAAEAELNKRASRGLGF